MNADEENEDDPVILELPVYICNEFQGSTTQLALFQHPLRAPWRPYDYHKVKQLRMKPNARKVEVDLPVDPESRNYNDVIDDFKKIKKVTLRSQQVEATTSLALGTIQDGNFLLMPIDYSLHLRPALSHLNMGTSAKKGRVDDDEDSDDEPSMRAVEVQVQKRETERQQQARLNSYAYLSQKEEEEPWLNLNLHTADSGPADSVWGRFVSPKAVSLDADMSRTTYLRAFVPSLDSMEAGAAGQPPDTDAQQQQFTSLEPLTEAQAPALLASVRTLFAKHSVCNMGNVRQWLQQDTAAREIAQVADKALHTALMATGLLGCIRRVYMLKSNDNPGTDPLRGVVLTLLEDKETFKRSEVIEAAQLKNITVSDTLYNRVVKDVCQSRGYQWLLKNGADMQS